MQSLREYITTNAIAGAEVGEVRVTRCDILATASVVLPAGIDLAERADRMNAFWEKLVEFQYRDVLVVALCVGE